MLRNTTHRQRNRPFDLGQLPDEAQALICWLVSTPSCPAGALLARVSKSWGAAAARYSRFATSISLGLRAQPDSPTQQKQREAQRLESLAQWLKRYGHAATSFRVWASTSSEQKGGFVTWRSQKVEGVVKALAAAGQQRRGLPLKQLQLPAIGGTPARTLSQALQWCPLLQQLQLDYCYGDETIHPAEYFSPALGVSLQRLTRLTSLKLEVGMNSWIWDGIQADPYPGSMLSLDPFFQHLPSSLEALHLKVVQGAQQPRCIYLHTSSLGHLVALKQLTLPEDLNVFSSSYAYPLLALTSLSYSHALDAFGWALLPLSPNLVQLEADKADAQSLAYLAGMQALRSLSCQPVIHGDAAAAAAAVARLTQLTQLVAPLWGLAGVAPAELAQWWAGLKQLQGLHTLSLQGNMLELVELGCFPALTRLTIDLSKGAWGRHGACTIQEQQQLLLRRLAPARGRVLGVVLTGVQRCRQVACRAAVAVALGNVTLICNP